MNDMKNNIIKTIIAAAMAAGTIVSCDYLDVSDELAGGITSFEDVFNNVDRTKRWYGQIYDNLPQSSRMWSTASMGNCWSFYTDEVWCRIGTTSGKYNEWNSASTTSHRWYELYESIRQCNIFLEQAHAITNDTGSGADRLTEAEINTYKANARFMRAAYHYWLFEQYGPIPIIKQSFTLEDDLDIPRSSVDEVVNWIDQELTECMEGMAQEPYTGNENYNAVPTKGAALALRAKLWVYAASPLFNGSWTPGAGLVNKDGKALFPANDPAEQERKINTAVTKLKEFIDYANAGRYELVKTGNPDADLYNVFMGDSKEIIWANSAQMWGGVGSSENFDLHCTPRQVNGLGGMELLQEFIDDFYCADGRPIEDEPELGLTKSPGYNETGFTKMYAEDAARWGAFPGMEDIDGSSDETGPVKDIEVFNMYVNREPRFYNTVTFSGKVWQVNNDEIQFYYGGKSDMTVVDGRPYTGYLLFKRYSRELFAEGGSNQVLTDYRPSIIFRLAEFYLLYAEMLNEQNPDNPEILTYLNKVRDRAGIPDIEELNPDILGNQDELRAVIQRESRIELATEGQRYFDVRRWLIAEKESGRQGGVFHGMNPSGTESIGDGGFFNRVTFTTRWFGEKYYLYPLPLDEIKRSEVLVQNPGW